MHRSQAPAKRQKVVDPSNLYDKMYTAHMSMQKEMTAMRKELTNATGTLSTLVEAKVLEKSPVNFCPAGTELELQALIKSTKVKK